MAKQTLFEKIKQSGHLPQLPQVMLQLIRACNNGQTKVSELTRIISADPALTSKLMQIMGSSYINLPKEVTNIKAAVVYLGMDTIRNIAISSSAMHFFSVAKKLPEFNIHTFWYQSYKTAVMARLMAQEIQESDPEEYFLAGLLHNIGRLVLIQLYPREYGVLLGKAVDEEELVPMEGRLLEMDSPRVGAWLFRHWGLSSDMADALGDLHSPLAKIIDAPTHVQILHLARAMSGPQGVETLARMAPHSPISSARMVALSNQAEEEVSEMAWALGIQVSGPHRSSREEAHLAKEVKDFSLFYGTLEQLLQARRPEQIKEVLEQGLRILFQVPRVFFFFLNRRGDMLNGTAAARDKRLKLIESIALPLANTQSLLVESLNAMTSLNSFDRDPHRAVAGSDSQILRLLDTPGFYTLPVAGSSGPLGLMVLGCDLRVKKHLEKSQGVLGLFVRQTALCLENLRFSRESARRINEKKMEAYTTMTDKVVHEINNPLSIIETYMDSLSLKLPDKHPAQDDLSVVREEMKRISLLLEGLSRYSRPRIGGFDLINVNQLIQRIMDILTKSLLLPRHIEPHLDLDPDLPPVKTDPNGLKQVIINLVKNSAEALGNGGMIEVKTRYNAQSARILIDEKQKLPGCIDIQVRDSGPGIPEGVMAHLFEPYNSSKTGGKNKGLGLAVVHSIVKELKGQIRCQSKPERGTVFSVRLPVRGE